MVFQIPPNRTTMNLFRNAIILLFVIATSVNISAQNVVLVIIDGARYSETLGDPNHTYIPEMWDLAQEGAYIDPFYNDSITFTSSAIPAIWCGAWTDRTDTVYNGGSTFYTDKPSLFEYFLKQKELPREKCLYSLKFISSSLWLQSFHPEYGPDYWPYIVSSGNSDDDVLQNTLSHIEQHKPQFMVVYLANTDSAGHSGNWNEYVSALSEADRIVGELWRILQNDAFYKDKTTIMITNDHGRHDPANGGFQGHGDGCDGCRQIMFLAAGPTIKKGFVSTEFHSIPDAAVTAASVLGVDMEFSTGTVMEEIFETTSVPNNITDLDWKATSSYVEVTAPVGTYVSINAIDLSGKKLLRIAEGQMNHPHSILGANWAQRLPSGIYLVHLKAGDRHSSQKVFVP